MVVKTAVLKELETLYAKSGNQLCVLYGRPDLEKELLLKTFLQNKKAFYYRARYASPESQKQMMAEALEEKLQVRLQKYDYEEYFNRIKSGGPEKLILVIDEFSYIAKKDTDFINAVLKLKAKKLYRHRCSEKDRSDDQAFQSEFSGSCACTSGLSGQRMYSGLRRDRRGYRLYQSLEPEGRFKDQHLQADFIKKRLYV